MGEGGYRIPVFVDREYLKSASGFSDSFQLGCGFSVIITGDFKPYRKGAS